MFGTFETHSSSCLTNIQQKFKLGGAYNFGKNHLKYKSNISKSKTFLSQEGYVSHACRIWLQHFMYHLIQNSMIKSSLKIITENSFNICPCFVTMKLDLSNGLLMSKSYQIITRTYSWHIFWRELVGRITNQKTGFSNGSVANYDALNRLHIESSKYLKTHYKHKRC